MAHSPGDVVGSYRLLEAIGKGGMGVVYLAEHVRLKRKVAVKLLRSEYTSNAEALHRFFTEARAANKVRHQNIVEVTDFVEDGSGDNYYVMEYLKGTDLGSVIDGSGALTLSRALAIMVQVAGALEAAHGACIVHRDLKPENVFLIERGATRDFVKLLDFGIAKLMDPTEPVSIHATSAGVVLGTPSYMSPEQASGTTIDARTDIYTFGVMLYELITGVLPFIGESFGELVVKHLTVKPVPPRLLAGLPHEIPAALDELVMACLAKTPGERPQTIANVREALLTIARAEGWDVSLPMTGPVPIARVTEVIDLIHRKRSSQPIFLETFGPTVRPRSKNRVLAAGVAIASTLMMGSVAVIASQSHPHHAQVETLPTTAVLPSPPVALAVTAPPPVATPTPTLPAKPIAAPVLRSTPVGAAHPRATKSSPKRVAPPVSHPHAPALVPNLAVDRSAVMNPFKQ